MPVCCRCNGSGRCISCSCVKSGSPCVNCLPLRNGHCGNAGIRALTSPPKDRQHPNVPPQLGEPTTADTDQVPSRQALTETGPPLSLSDTSLVNTLQSPGVVEHASYCASTRKLPMRYHRYAPFPCSNQCHPWIAFGERNPDRTCLMLLTVHTDT